MKTIVITAIATTLVLLGIYWQFGDSFLSTSPTTEEISLPYYQTNVSLNDSFACKAVVSGFVSADVVENTVTGDIAEGTDEIALFVKDEDTLIMTTAASIRLGIAEGDEMRIFENDEEKLTAIWYGAGNGVISTIVLNKNNGLAVWNKANPDFAFLGFPTGQVIYMSCL